MTESLFHGLMSFLQGWVRATGLVILLPIGSIRNRTLIAALFGLTAITTTPTGVNFFSFIGEFLLGLALGLPLSLLFSAITALAECIESAKGQYVPSFYDPLFRAHQSPLATLFQNGWWAVYLMGGGGADLLTWYMGSLTSFPPGQLPIGLLGTEGIAALSLFSSLFTKLLSPFLLFAVVFLAVDVCFVLVSQIVPQLSLQSENGAVKAISTIFLFHFFGERMRPDELFHLV